MSQEDLAAMILFCIGAIVVTCTIAAILVWLV